jgi:hypothetical protein
MPHRRLPLNQERYQAPAPKPDLTSALLIIIQSLMNLECLSEAWMKFKAVRDRLGH